ncbi:MAG TPA: AAA family ATPase [Solirubrobacterales bacterium]|nr:AAA family ATPase [Solirubrobacterales bacterium]
MADLLDREPEIQELDARVEAALAGEGSLAVIEGPAGIGKSRLLAEARRRAGRSMRVLSARGGELEGEFPFGVVRQLFDPELTDPERREQLLAGAAAPAAAIFGAPEPGDEGGQGASFASLHGAFWLVMELAEERPLLLCVDDLHWCDRPSLMFLAYLARRIESQPVLLLTGLREAEPGTDPALLAELTQDPSATRVRPGPLSEAAIGALLGERLGAEPAPAFVAACREATGGNALLLSQLVTALRGEGVQPDAEHVARVTEIGPRAVSRTVLLRLARLPEEAKAVAQAVAVLGDGAALPAVIELAGVDEAAAAAATRELSRAEILRPEPPLGFVHPLVRDAVYHELSPGERELEHARAAALLRDGGAPVDQVAAQLLHTSPRGEAWAAELMWEAGRAAMHAGAAESAAAYLRRALAELPGDGERGRLLFELGAAEALTSGAPAQEHLTLAYEELEDPTARAIAAGMLGRTLLFMGAPEEAAATARRAADELPPELEDVRLSLEALESITVFFGAEQRDRLTRLREFRRAPSGGPGAHGVVSIAAWEALCTDGTAEECTALALAALEGGELRAADPALLPFGAIVSLVVADRPEVVDVWKEFLDDAHRRGSLLSTSSVLLWHGYSHLRRGDLAAAEDSMRSADEMFTLWGHDEYARINSRSLMAEVMCEQGRTEEAERLLELVGEVAPGTHATSNWLTARFALLAATGRAEEALAVADELAAQCAAVPDPSRLWWRSLKAEALDRLERTDEGIELAREQLEVARAFGAPRWTGRALRVLGTLERDDGIEALRESVAVLEGSTARLEQAKALAALGSGLRRARQPSEAREPLRQALEQAGICGATALSEQVRTELHATGSRPRNDALSGVGSLTPSERRVADLAAAGNTNREIAQQLYVTPKTVEVHLSNTYRKLGIRSRRELERALAGVAS